MAANVDDIQRSLEMAFFDIQRAASRRPISRNVARLDEFGTLLGEGDQAERYKEIIQTGLRDAGILKQNLAQLSQLNSLAEFTKKAMAGLRAMDASPRSWKSLDRYFKWSDLTSKRKSSELHRRQSIVDAVMKISNPDYFHELSLRREYGDTGAEQILSAERSKARKKGQTEAAESKIRGRYSYWYDTLSKQEQRRWDYTKRYGGGAQGRMYADARIQEEENKALHDTKGRIASRNRQLTVQMMKEFPLFFANSKRSTKDIKALAKSMKKLERMPVVGRAILSAMRNPLGAAVGAATTGYALMGSILSASDSANEQTTNWMNVANLFGSPKEGSRFTGAAFLAGMRDPSAILKKYGMARFKYGDADNFYTNIGKIMRSAKDPRMKMAIAQKLGFDETDVVLAQIMAGDKSVLTEDRLTAARKAELEVEKTTGWRTGSGIEATARSLGLSVPWATSVEARTGANPLEWIFTPEKAAYKSMALEVQKADSAKAAAISADRYSAESANASGGSNVTISINGINISGASEAGKSIIDLVLKYGPESKDVLDSIDPRAR